MNVYRFRIPFVKPIPFKGEMHSHREGVLLERNGRWAEASPLPGFSSESIAEVVSALRDGAQPPPSLDFALSTLDRELKGPLNVPYNQLLMGDQSEVLAAAQGNADSNCAAVKLKVGRQSLDADVRLARDVKASLPQGVSLRLDANQAWSFEEAIEFHRATEGTEFEYIEEPLKDPMRLESLYSQTGIRYAVDESLVGNHSLEHWPNAAAFICKPTILGGRHAIERLAKAGKPIVFSSAFESGVGVIRIMQLAAEFSPQIPAGLDTLSWMQEDLLLHAPQKQDGFMSVGELAVDESKLEPVQI